MNAISKRLLSGLMVLVMVLSMVPALNLTNFAVETKATENGIGGFNQEAAVEHKSDVMTEMAKNQIDFSDVAFFGQDGELGGEDGGYIEENYCPVCKTTVTWEEKNYRFDGANDESKHYYMTWGSRTGTNNNRVIYAASGTNRNVCVFVPSTVNVEVSIQPITLKATNSTYNFMGSGKMLQIEGANYNTASVVGGTSTLNLFGITFGSQKQWEAIDVIDLRETGTINMYAGATVGMMEQEEVDSRSVIRMQGTCTLNMYGGTIQNGYSNHPSITGGNISLEGGTVNMYGGTITGGKSANNGGNIYVNGGTFNMFGGTVSNGYATKHGGNIYVGSSSNVNIQGGTILGGEAATYGGNIRVYGGESATFGGLVLIANGDASVGDNMQVETNTTVDGGVIVGEVAMGANATLTLKNAPKIVTTYTADEETYTGVIGLGFGGVPANIDDLSADAEIVVNAEADTILTAASTNAATVKDCFKVGDDLEVIVNDDNQLVVKAIVVAVPIADLYIDGEQPTEYSDPVALIAAYEAAKEAGKTAYIYTYKAYQAGYGAGNAAESPFLELELHEGYEYYIDLHNAFVQLSGAGTLYALDYSNGDDFHGNGKFRIADGADITVAPAAVHPKDDFLYISVEPCDLEEKNCVEGDWMAFRVTAELTGISMRPSEAGWYYKSEYNFAERLYKIGAVAQYGVALNGDTDITEDYFVGQANLNKYTKCTEAVDADDTTNGIQVSGTSGGLFGILKKTETGRSAEANATALDADIYAKAYVLVDRYPTLPAGQDPGDRYYYVMSDGSVVDTLHEVLDKVNDKVAAGEITEEGKQQKLIAMYNEWNDATEMSLAGQQAWQTINADIAALAALIGG